MVPVKDEGYRLCVNGPMMKGADVKPGQTADFIIEQDTPERNKTHPMPAALKKKREEHDLLKMFLELAPSRQKEINRYLNNLKSEEALTKNIDKMINALKGKVSSILLPKNDHATTQRRNEYKRQLTWRRCLVARETSPGLSLLRSSQ